MTRIQNRIALWSGLCTILVAVIVVLQFLGIDTLGVFGGDGCTGRTRFLGRC